MPSDPSSHAQSLLELAERRVFVGVWTLELATGRLHWSDALARIHGAPPGYAPQRVDLLAHYADDGRERMSRHIEACAVDGVAFDVEAQVLTLEGERRWVRSIGEAVRDGAGRISGLQGLLQEIAPQGHTPGTLLQHAFSMAGAPGSGDAFLTVDAHGGITFANDEARRLLGEADPLGRKLWNFFLKTARLALEEQFLSAAAHGRVIELEEGDTRAVRWLELRGFPFAGGLAVHLRDVTAQHREHEHLRLLEGSIGRVNDIVIITEAGPFSAPGPRIVFVNEAFERRTGYAREDVIGRTPRLLQGPDTQREALDRIRAALEEWQRVRVDVINYTRAGEPFWVDLDISPVWDEARRLTHWVAVGRDITERKMAEEKIQYLAFFDALTQLPNRQSLMDRLDAALAAQPPRRGALMFIDLDNFKVLNDTMGHQRGDMLLLQVARRLRACVAKGDLVARLGGDEFVVLLEDMPGKPVEPVSTARLVSQRILAALGDPYDLEGTLHDGSCSIGVTLFGGTPTSVSELLKQADLAMYDAKSAGRNTVRFFDPGMQAAASANAQLAVDLRQAWRDRALTIHYQPQVGADGRMSGVEALLRWNRAAHGAVDPATFIPVAEESGLIIPIGRWVLDRACEQLALWARRPDRADLGIAVNVSVRQFRHPGFVEELTASLARHGVAPCKLRLELTESLLANGIDDTVAKMAALKAMGIGLSLDDFGIGYSALSYLKRLPLDQLKIDREFVRDILTDPNDAAIARTIIGLAHSLGLGVIAEGVETQAQRAYLASQGCPEYQGYLFCRPLPIEQLEVFMEALITPVPSEVAT